MSAIGAFWGVNRRARQRPRHSPRFGTLFAVDQCAFATLDEAREYAATLGEI